MGGTTAHGFPYPVGTDRVADGDNAIQALAQALDTYVANRPRCRVNLANQAIPHNVTTDLVFSGSGASVVYDTDSMVDMAGNRIVIKTAGLYVVSGMLIWGGAASPAGNRVGLIYRNPPGAYIAQDYRTPTVSGAPSNNMHSGPIQLSAGDVLTVRALQTQGVSLNTGAANGQQQWIAVAWWLGQ